MIKRLLVLFSKVLIKILRIFGKNGSALPGLLIERLYPDFLYQTLQSVQDKIVLVTGTNGKTTTTKMLVEGLRGTGLTVVTNATGSNMTRGLIAALVEDMTYTGSLKPTDWFIFEMDEAYAPIFANRLSPHLTIGLNVLRDQLDRYGEIDTTAKLISQAAAQSKNYIYNCLDPLLSRDVHQLSKQGVETISFGAADSLLASVRNEQTLYGSTTDSATHSAHVEILELQPEGDMQHLTLGSHDRDVEMTIPVKGFHNALNATAVLAALEVLAPKQLTAAVEVISRMPVPFGRGERLHLQHKDITVALVKNPSGFASNLETFVTAANPEAILFVVNDKLADGRDVSWLWDVEFAQAVSAKTQIYVSGIRAYDMALRLKHDGLSSQVIPGVTSAIESIMSSKHNNIVIIPTYTALFEVRSALARYGRVPRIW